MLPVDAGDLIGLSGATGNVTGEYLHWCDQPPGAALRRAPALVRPADSEPPHQYPDSEPDPESEA